MPPSDEGGVKAFALTEGENFILEYNKNNVNLAKKLRKNMTMWEKKLWYNFLRDYPIRFQRQKCIDNYIVDFYCAKARLVVELDGGGHYEEKQIEKDNIRTQCLNKLNLKVIRLTDTEIIKKFKESCEYIDKIVKTQLSLPQSASLPAPSSEGALKTLKFCERNEKNGKKQKI